MSGVLVVVVVAVIGVFHCEGEERAVYIHKDNLHGCYQMEEGAI